MNVHNGGFHMQRLALHVKIFSPLQIVWEYLIFTSKQWLKVYVQNGVILGDAYNETMI